MSIDDSTVPRSAAGSAGVQRAARRRVTKIEDVAALVGVSASTVSRALARPERVLPETRARILEAVRLTGYTPNPAARTLRAARSMNVLVVLSSPGHGESMVSAFFNELLMAVDLTLSDAGYGVLLGNLYQSAEREERVVNLVAAGQVDGVLLMLSRMPKASGRSLAESGVPMVSVTTPAAPDLPLVAIDEEAAAAAVARHLLELGHRRFGYLGGPADHAIEQRRHAGFMATLAEAGIGADAVVRYPGDFRVGSGRRAGQAFVADRTRPSAVFAISDEMAIGFMKAVRQGGLAVPADLSLVGFDGIPFAEFCEPPLTTVRQPRELLGRTAAQLLVALMQGTELSAEQRCIRFGAELWLGGTTAPPST